MKFIMDFPVGITFDLGIVLLGYFCGSLPFSLWVTQMMRGVDVRSSGSGHATATNTMRQAGWRAGVMVLFLDIVKGFFPVYLAQVYGIHGWVVPFTATLAVLGHCWPLFAGFRGGMGLATSGGAILVVSPLGFLIGVGVLIVLVLIFRHSARASVVAGLLLPWIYWLIRFRGDLFWVTLGVGIVVAVRFFDDWNRKYRELWLDRQV